LARSLAPLSISNSPCSRKRRMVKILEHPENQKSAMIDNSHERQSVGSSPGVRNGTGEPGTASAERVPGCAGINRHGSEDARASRERNSNPLGPEFCTGRCEMFSEA
jgi:hypothetical protein